MLMSLGVAAIEDINIAQAQPSQVPLAKCGLPPQTSSELRRRVSMQIDIPPHHPVHALNASVLGFVNSAIPHFPVDATPIPETPAEEREWIRYQNLWLKLEEPTPPPTHLKWSRVLRFPSHLVGRKLAGKWDHDNEKKVKTEDAEAVKSIKTAPSIL